MSTMTVVMPAEMIAERQRLGLDVRDEVWDGVYHVVPLATEPHQWFGTQLIGILLPLAQRGGFRVAYETGLFDPARRRNRDYRIPDLLVYRPERAIPAGVNGRAELAIEIRSPDDDSLLKLPYYSRVGVQELLIIERDTKEVRHWVAGAGGLSETSPLENGWHCLAAVPMRVRGVDGHLEVDPGTGVIVI